MSLLAIHVLLMLESIILAINVQLYSFYLGLLRSIYCDYTIYNICLLYGVLFLFEFFQFGFTKRSTVNTAIITIVIIEINS